MLQRWRLFHCNSRCIQNTLLGGQEREKKKKEGGGGEQPNTRGDSP